jgi:adenosylmethionine-8-amino-7-oxononanoate aminotransferase
VTPLLERLDDIAAIVIEPVLQGAGGMYIYPPETVRWLADQARARGWLLIFDEIATGFGRTGTMFAKEHADVQPDILCVGKALSAGYLTLAATLCAGAVAEGIAASESGVLMHGPTYMANALACAVANANLDLLSNGDPLTEVARINRGLTDGLRPATDLPNVKGVRTLGAVGVIQLDQPVDVSRATKTALDNGVWIRPFRDLIYAMPPYITDDADLAQITAAMVLAAKDQS